MNKLNPLVWENRHTTRLFSDTGPIPDEDVEYLATVINHVPTQCSIKSHFWMYLGQGDEDMKMRTWLADNIYYMTNKEEHGDDKEHMLAVVQAPAVLVCVRTSTPWANPEEGKSAEDQNHLADRSEGFVAGAILSTLLNMGYSVATFGCTHGMHAEGNGREKCETFTKMIKERFGTELENMINTYPGKQGNWDDISFFPGLTNSFGPEAIDILAPTEGELETWVSKAGKEYKFINGTKLRTPVDSTVGF